MYVGMSKNLRQRHMTYARTGSHIPELIEAALLQGNVLWRRFYTVPTELHAQQEEMLCQTVLDYPWNKDQNPNGTRFVYTRKASLFGKVRRRGLSWVSGCDDGGRWHLDAATGGRNNRFVFCNHRTSAVHACALCRSWW